MENIITQIIKNINNKKLPENKENVKILHLLKNINIKNYKNIYSSNIVVGSDINQTIYNLMYGHIIKIGVFMLNDVNTNFDLSKILFNYNVIHI